MTDTANDVALLQQLLEETAAAHGVHEETVLGGVYDVEWPAWYAEHMAGLLEQRGLALVKRG